MSGRKYFWIAGGMLWVLLLEIAMLWNNRPELSKISGDIAMSADMTCFVVDETEKKPVFYEVNKNGEILRFFRDTSEKGRIFCMTWAEEGICYLKQENAAEKKDIYEIYQMNRDMRQNRHMGRLELKKGSRLAEMEFDGSHMNIVVIEENSAGLSLYQFEMDQKIPVRPQLSQSLEAKDGMRFTDGTCWEEKLYALTDSGFIIAAEKGGGEIKEEKSGAVWLTGTRAGIVFEDYPERNLYIKGSAGTKKYQDQEHAVHADAMSQKAFWTLQRINGDSCFLNLTQNKKNTKVTKLHMEMKNYLSLRKWQILKAAVIGTGVWLMLAAMIVILKGKPPLWIKAAAAVLGIQFLAGTVVTAMEVPEEWEEMALLWGNQEIRRMEQSITGFPDQEILKQEENLKLLRTEEQCQGKIKISSMVIYSKEGKGYIISAPNQTYGYDLRKLCSQKTLDTITRAADEGKAESVSARGSSVYTEAVIPLGDRIAADTFLIVQAKYQRETENAWQKYHMFFWILADSILLGFVCFILFHPVKKFAAAVSRMAEGKEEKIPVSGSRELEQAWHSVQVLLFQRERERHEAERKILSFRRFVPEYFTELMKKERMDQIVPGEIKITNGGFLQIYLGDFKEMKEAEYGAQISRLMELFEQERGQKAGVLFPDGNRLGSMRIIYENEPKAAVQDAIGVWKRINSTKEPTKRLNPLFLLHCGSCMCGVTGTGRQVIPFAVSKELKRLAAIAEQFRKNGVRMAVTEEIRPCLEPEQECRYVGFIREEEKKYRFYEVLEVYPEEEKQRRSRTKEKFEASIELFYQNDFYLARLGFSEVLKECPKDRLAVWYLFACERMFHGNHGTEHIHDLFAEVAEEKS